MDPNNFLTEFKEGGSHEENPLGGIPQGMGSNGKMNTVEEGETRRGDYVFSDRLKITDDMIKKYNLPKNLKNKTFADASKSVGKLTEGNPNSTVERETAKEMIERLTLASEEARVMEELKNNPQMVQQLAQQMQGGGQGIPQGLQPEGMGMEGIPQQEISPQGMNPQMMGLEEGMPEEMGMPMQQQFFSGGAMEGTVNTMTPHGPVKMTPSPAANTSNLSANGVSGSGGGGLSSGAMSGIATGLSVAGNMLRKPQDKTIIAGDPTTNQAITGVKSAVATATGPIGSAFFAASEAGKGLGDAIGGEVGAGIADAFSPEESTASIFTTNKDASWDEKIALTMPIVGGIANKRLQDRKKAEKLKLRDMKNSMPNYAKYGGNLNRFENGGPMNETNQYRNSGNLNNDPYRPYDPYGLSNILSSFRPLDYASNRGIMNNDGSLTDAARYDRDKARDEVVSTVNKIYGGTKAKSTDDDDDDDKSFWSKLGDGATQAMRYAPALTDAYQLATLSKPEQESLDRLNRRYKRNYVDERQIQNTISNEYNNAVNSLTGASGGSASALRANLQGANLSRLKAMSDAYINAENINRNEDAIAQQFDLSVNSTNLQQSNTEKEMNAQNRAAYDNNKSMLISQLGKNIGNIGLEEMRKKYPEWLDLYFDHKGRFRNTDNA